MADSYQYQKKPLPPLPQVGGDAGSHLSESPQLSPSLNIADAGQIYDPFNNSAGSGGSGGGGTTPTCATDWDIGTIQTSTINLPCTSPRSTFGPNAIALSDGSGNTGEFSAINQRVTLSGGTVGLDIDMADASADSVSIKINELNVCHLGDAGFRDFVCGDAHA